MHHSLSLLLKQKATCKRALHKVIWEGYPKFVLLCMFCSEFYVCHCVGTESNR